MAPQQPVTNYAMNFDKEAPSAPQLFYACPCIAHKWSTEGWILGYSEGKLSIFSQTEYNELHRIRSNYLEICVEVLDLFGFSTVIILNNHPQRYDFVRD